MDKKKIMSGLLSFFVLDANRKYEALYMFSIITKSGLFEIINQARGHVDPSIRSLFQI